MEGNVQDGKVRSGGNSYASTPASKKKVDEGIWASLSKTAKSLFSEEDDLPRVDEVRVDQQQAPATKQTGESKAFGIQKSLDAITNSLSFIGDKVGTAIEESLDVISTKAVDFIEGPPPSLNHDLKRSPSIGVDGSPVTNQLKASRDVATAMVTKVRQYQRQVEAQKAQLDFATKRCSQLEEENKVLRDGLEVQGKMDDDPLVRQQLEALLAEKARLARENMQLQRENEHLFELLAYSTQGNRSPSVSAGVGAFEWEEEDGAVGTERGERELDGVPEENEVSSRDTGGDFAEALPTGADSIHAKDRDGDEGGVSEDREGDQSRVGKSPGSEGLTSKGQELKVDTQGVKVVSEVADKSGETNTG
ncbi:hypothetical protein KFL_000250360 [Klebsormidium nitens]|uniref:Uncharacterized protein n=1 Tax=Klebsormidium nitens TaxID=105231 RepID=A0A1Y1HPM3_KLENI|nr:hypothetical protein KFL_000250360 [Klebsormidium nitens]|eukprot:GAQ79159.1 hypothetical protein KFL_000250360 [Klebsormidium nitens]